MKTILVVCAIIGATLAEPLQPASLSSSRVVGGSNARPGQFTWMVSMRMRQNNMHFCGGAVLNSYWVVTAAHCLDNQNPADFYIQVGSIYLNSGGDLYGISRFIPHPRYSAQNFKNDIGLMKIAGPIQGRPGLVESINLSTDYFPANVILTLSGWGSTTPGSASPNVLQNINLASIDTGACKRAWDQINPVYSIDDSQVCTFVGMGQGSCQGDSGGPLVYGTTLVGVVSFGKPCAVGVPDVFTRAGQFVPWIQATMQSN